MLLPHLQKNTSVIVFAIMSTPTRRTRSSAHWDKEDLARKGEATADNVEGDETEVASSPRRSKRSANQTNKKPRLDKTPEDDIEPDNDADDNGMSALERARLENIRRNEELLHELGIASIKASIAGPPKPIKTIKKDFGRRNYPTGPAVPTRRSSRVTVDKLTLEVQRLREEGKEEEAALRQVELDEMIAKQQQGAYIVQAVESGAGESQYERLPPDPLALSTSLTNYDEEEKESAAQELKSSLQTAYSSLGSAKSKKQSSKSSVDSWLDPLPAHFSSLSLNELEVEKLTANRCASVALHPSTRKILAAAGDKSGNLGLWDVEGSTGEQKEQGGVVYRYHPHNSNLMKIMFMQDKAERLFTFSYDGTIRCLDLEQNAFVSMFTAPEDLSDMYATDVTALSADQVLFSKSNGEISLIDYRASDSGYQWTCTAQESRVTSVQLHPTQPDYIVTGSTKAGVGVHDLRKLSKNTAKPVNTLDIHKKSITAAYISPDGQYLVSVSSDDTIKATIDFMSSSYTTTSLAHNNQTGRWLSTFRPAFDPKRASTFVTGSMMQPRRMEIFSASTTSTGLPRLTLLRNMQSEYLASVCSRCCFHPHLDMVLGSNSSGKVHLFR